MDNKFLDNSALQTFPVVFFLSSSSYWQYSFTDAFLQDGQKIEKFILILPFLVFYKLCLILIVVSLKFCPCVGFGFKLKKTKVLQGPASPLAIWRLVLILIIVKFHCFSNFSPRNSRRFGDTPKYTYLFFLSKE